MLLLAACSKGGAQTVSSSPMSPSPSPTLVSQPASTARPAVLEVNAAFDVDNVLSVAREIVGLGPREATSSAYDDAARFVEDRLAGFGYTVRRQRVTVPAGTWRSYRLPAGRTVNVVAEPRGFDPSVPSLIVGAHLDTVPGSPGANDNASGVAIMIELARLGALRPPRTPIVFVAFGAEEPRNPMGHHFGSVRFVRSLGTAARSSLAGMVSVDMVGAGRSVLVCTGGRSPSTLVDALLARAKRLRLSARACPQPNVNSDHWSFEQKGFPVAWLWGGRHPAYHSPRDRFEVLEAKQLDRVGRLAWETLRRFVPS